MIEVVVCCVAVLGSAFLGVIMFLLNDIRNQMRQLDKGLNDFKEKVISDYVTYEELREHCQMRHDKNEPKI
jgi:hypothetical protein